MSHFRRSASILWPAALVAVTVIIATPAHGDEIADARRAFISGMKHFDLGEYGQALADFKNGYRAKEDPVFLYNIAQCHRMLKENRDAIRYYRLYLSRAPDAPNRSEIEERIAKLQAIVDAENQTPPTAPSTNATPPPPTPIAAAAITATASAPTRLRPTPVYKKWWLWTIVGAVAVGAGVGLGVGLTRGSSASGTSFPTAGF